MAAFRNYATVLLLCCAAAVVVADLAPGVAIDRPRTDRGSFKGADAVQITGTGFRTYSQVMCFFGDQFASYEAEVLSDTRIQCRTPFIDASDSIFGFPLTTTLSVMFDGIPETETLLEDVFILGPTLDSFSPSSGFVEGGNSLTLHGTNFDDFEKLQVFLDDAECPVTVREDERVVCTVPAGEFNQNALVSMIFDENEQYYLHSRDTYHYGPVFTSIEPECSSLLGGSTITVSGVNLDDPILGEFQFPDGVQPTVELVISLNGDDDADAGDIRFFGTNVTMSASAGTVEFVTPFISGDVFGVQPLISVDFKQLNSRAVAVPSQLTLGPVVYTARQLPTGVAGIDNPSPQAGHRGGGDIIVVSGCGLSDFTNAEVSVLMDVANTERELCVRGAGPGTPSDTLTIFEGCNNGIAGCDQIFCFTNPEDCTGAPSLLARQVSVAFTPAESQFTLSPYVLPREGFMTYAVGPSVDAVDIDRTDFTGGEPFTITGTNFFEAAFNTEEDPGWGTVTVNFEANGETASAEATIVSDTELVGVTPSFNFNSLASVSVDFQLNPSDNSCTDLPRDIDLTPVFFGPTCSSMTPSNGFLSGGQTVTLHGVGFLEADPTDIEILICLERLNPLVGLCDVFEPVDLSTVTVTESTITFTTPSDRQGVTTNVGSNRLFGDVANVYLHYTSINTVQPLVYCGDYRFGPDVTAVTPNKGPSGPLPSPHTAVNIKGTSFNDPAYNFDLISSMGEVANEDTTIRTRSQPDSNLDAFTTYTDESGVDKSVNVIFGASNTTSSDFNVTWGPTITTLQGPFGDNVGDVWGLLPGGGQELSVFGEGFDEYLVGSDVDARCLIDGLEATLVTHLDEGNSVSHLGCITPAIPFGSAAHVSIDFGSTCGNEDRPNFRNRVTASNLVHYTPRIDSISPDYGLTSGGQEVTVTGEGFEGWGAYECFFGHYTDNVDVSGTVTDTQVICTTPHNRGEFGTDVTVHIQLDDPNQTDIFHMKVVSPETYHYGAVCNSVSPATGYLDGGYTITINGDGFIDCVDSDTAPFRDCTFNSDLIEVFFENLDGTTELRGAVVDILSVTDTTLEVTIPGGVCDEHTNIYLVFEGGFVSEPLTQLRVDCGVDALDEDFHYGPVFASQSSEFAIGDDSFGWTSDEITISGVNFDDPALGDPVCIFGEFGAGLTNSFDDNTIVCSAPVGDWDAWASVTVEWSTFSNTTTGCTGETAMAAGRFHYGPEISTISPERGYVRDQTEVTITGFAFECCGINSYEFVWPSGAEGVFANQTVFTAPNSVSAPVPQNDAIDNRVNFIGVRFGSPFFNSTTVDTFLSKTGDGSGLNYYYGPFVDSISPERSSLSGNGISVTIHGEGFLDPYFLATYCDFISATGGIDDLGATPSLVTDKEIVCPVKTYNHVARDEDHLRPRWDRDGDQFRNNFGSIYVKTGEPNTIIPLEDNPLPFFRDNGGGAETLYGPILYGPVITDVQAVGSSSLRSDAAGGLQITVSFDDLSDWLSDASSNDYGSEQAVCLFGGVRISDPVPINSDNTVVCTVPRGYIGLSGDVSVVLDPHHDADTAIPTTANGHWRFLPFITTASNTLGQAPGYETITLQGGGFCGYDTAVCTFGGREAVQADITNDFTLTCQTPPHAPGEYPIEVSFCTGGNCFFDSTRDRVSAATTFQVAGVTSISPPEGSLCGGTEVTFTGHGFELYDFLTCQFGGFPRVSASRVNDTAATCFTPNFELNGVQRPIQCLDAVLVGHKGSNEGFPMLSPIAFEAGFPQPQSTDPVNADVDFSITVTVAGRYFNGGFDRDGEYFCSFGGILTPATLHPFTEGALGDKLFALTCPTPTRFTNPELTVGEVDFEVIFDCGTLVDLSSSSTKFRFGQVPRIFDYEPKKGEEIGGTTVTVSGDNFAGGSLYLCSFGELGVDNQVVAAHFDTTTPEITCETPALVVDRSVNVDFHISIDGGLEWTRFDEKFTYQNVVRKCDSDSDGDDDDDSSAGMLVAHLLPVVLALCVLFL
mmetsp:Transcript_3150/g.11008  ORF Transcript_3150/g.11008 Transcript_3150/m.11008 type:complete len:2005 (+) Transcript_3150:199-6213(+)|eukprot:CAMPEP_0114612072 /NCGR_PEP_ID=MMETSP0168-20121206/4437_1 /TAXON_ID=95228 ORGANISM="Vannella sp., Strain DIVA3 517/6/12" /NCGR_SAMPLE_ID=MMETSP0168 /ASSEMBLY_ACC=CAM_ASM_000044 /LENGTH=2004 /DNA_ID=CAMNT_0001823053 /DNA_START=197 /DNA_END=6211 /DNA_ORIENTATION=+